MTFWGFAAVNPLIALLMVFLAVMLVRSLCYRISAMWRCWLRSKNIRAAGWPIAPIDADGDVIRPISAAEVADAVLEKLNDDYVIRRRR